jgi:hypothetical protein
MHTFFGRFRIVGLLEKNAYLGIRKPELAVHVAAIK